ncbi:MULTISPECIES: phosphonate C-P lyase system protein PhnH [Pandoraea]|jgi:alpha-D-ribose 1-methylphosphonate 5-triphosphate synthase subunit PhnH|uniref:phosphonate C-P lyase system protein PhnH n=1 Tax=Pandoraea TaxID=93217 RepID=UPI0003D1CFC0|nr:MULTISPECIES: phosphonate C-P lyase system protein PhnH [Pandoraea]AHB76314.1 phosphonate C-P lyase system protein PhnH [Pandoraea pnomenusa]QDH58303.1 phosphonate C-P lyase system protein PhnH [Pandoraea pnomenusa]
MSMTSMPDWSQLQPGFVDPVHDAQGVFRAVLDALARPGRLCSVGSRLAPSEQASVAARAVLLALADATTPVWLQSPLPEVASALRFHTGATLLSSESELAGAQFALLTDPAHCPPLERFAFGTAESPEHSATLIVDVPTLAAGHTAPRDQHFNSTLALRLRGPGIASHADVSVGGLDAAFWQSRAALAPRFPAGLDLLIAAGDRLLGLPRTTHVEVC